MMGAAKEGERLSPDAIAQAYVYLSQQDKSCWSQGMFFDLGLGLDHL